MKIFLTFVVLFLVQSSIASAQNDAGYYARKGWDAHNEGNYKKSIHFLLKADSLSPNHPTITRFLAIAYTKAEKYSEAFSYLDKLGLLWAREEILEQTHFSSISSMPRFQKLRKKFTEMNKMVSSSDTAFVLMDKLLHPEGVAYDSGRNRFMITSIRKGTIVNRLPTSAETEFSIPGMWAASGIAIDSERNVLWVSTTMPKEFQGYNETLRGQSKIMKINLSTGRLIQQFIPIDGKLHYFGDLTINPFSGTLYITDSRSSSIYHIHEKSEFVEEFVSMEGLNSLQGIAISPDNEYLFVSDYRDGIARIDISSKKWMSYETPENATLRGIDGLYYYKNSLIGIQNGVYPIRITKFELSEDGRKITSFRYLEKANPILNEPSLGVLVGDIFYYVANSLWPHYDRDGKLAPENMLPNPLVMKIDLTKF